MGDALDHLTTKEDMTDTEEDEIVAILEVEEKEEVVTDHHHIPEVDLVIDPEIDQEAMIEEQDAINLEAEAEIDPEDIKNTVSQFYLNEANQFNFAVFVVI
jgi:CO dehydrogenase/acetyl-CoA synthase alpha subunit